MAKNLISKSILAAIVVLSFLPSPKSKATPPGAGHNRRPKLIVILVIDQFRYEYLVRFRPQFVEGGFNLLLQGANFVDCRYDYAATVTCSGHASLFTGANPHIHGIIANRWYDRKLHEQVYCVSDSDTQNVGGPSGPGKSPHYMLGTTIGDELRMASQFKSKVISISLKDRASVVSGGHTANAAYWFDLDAGTFISSTYYMPSLPEWVARFNAEGPTKAYCGNPWRALEGSGSLGGQVWSEFRAEPGQPCPNRKFVHWLHETPFTNEVELNFAKEAVKNEALGKGPETDLLAVSLSSNDSIGHAYGPDSPQVADATLRTDRYLADFFSFLDQTVGLRNVWIALSADHGVAPTPAFVMEHHLGQGAADMGVVAKAMSHALSQAFGTDQWIEGQAGFQIYLNPVALRTHHVAQDHAELVAAQAAALVPGVQAAFTRHQLLFRPTLDSSLARKVGNSFFGPRSGDVYIVLEQFAVTVHEKSTTTHGSPWSYDAHVPLILWGDAFLPGDYSRPVEPVDLAPTLSAALGLDQPSGSEGKPLTIALKP